MIYETCEEFKRDAIHLRKFTFSVYISFFSEFIFKGQIYLEKNKIYIFTNCEKLNGSFPTTKHVSEFRYCKEIDQLKFHTNQWSHGCEIKEFFWEYDEYIQRILDLRVSENKIEKFLDI